MIKNKDHWYDGWFYDKIVAPNQDILFAQVKALIEPASNVIDVGCGTGRLAFALADRCKSVVGIDLSKRNMERAQLILHQNPNPKISFHHRYLSELIQDGQTHFDYAVLTFVIHEVNEAERVNLLHEIARVADQIIIGDYLAPKPSGLPGLMSESIEFLAGREHYRNYKNYVSNGGIYHLADKSGLKIRKDIRGHRSIDHLVVLSR